MMFLVKLSAWVTFLFYLFATTVLYWFLNGSYHWNRLWHRWTVPSRVQYEYIIVGTGTAGSIVAAGIPSSDVLVLEAGSMRAGLMDIPLMQPLLQKTAYDWQYRTESQKSACGAMVGKKSFWPSGKVFGGSHVFNNMVHYRAQREDFEGWFSGDNQLNQFMEYFQRWGEDELLQMEDTKFGTSLGEAFSLAGASLGLKEGSFYRPNVTTRKGDRWTTSHFYEQQKREAHELIFNALVLKVLIEKEIAVGVVFEKEGRIHEIRATKGVILSAGTIGSSKILLQSGIGPKGHLETIGTKSIVDLPVGENLQDHVSTGMDLVLLSKKLPLDPLSILSPFNLINYIFKEGNDSSISFGGCESLISLRSLNLGYMVLPVGLTIDSGRNLYKMINLRQDVWQKYYQPLIDNNQQSVTVLPILLSPASKGFVRLQSKDPHSNPIIQPNYLQAESDVQTLIKGIKILEKLLSQPALQQLGAELNPKPFPGCETLSFGTNPYWECYVKQLTLTVYHPIGTCRMGPVDDDEAVVSNRDFSVHKLQRLFVIDGSILPNLPSGNPNSVIVALAKYFLNVKFSVKV
ncbi:glucose dehydrogenase [FAD, quinone]-like [Uranotaenia lowii]|uniref:glucose dehydrogenase [FAD, quinone]-like n=1 Tax=Uranotaenia lowii TaxID=190385 RepID=UPI00247AB842|nr:glucose dehydrogenase [FAD, quinone]-like [Uranotaenia lowii]